MKNIRLFLIMSICTASLCLASCSKKKDDPKPTSIPGYWFGSANGGAFNQSFLLRADGTLKVYDFYGNGMSKDTTQAYDGTGTYTVSGNAITINTYFPNGQTFSATATLNLSASPATLSFPANADGYNGDVYRKQ